MYEEGVSMENSPTYSKGDIVWVKLSSYWWPGEVINEEDLPGDLMSDFKKPPLVIVKFFDEDSYEYVKNWSNIHPYNYNQKADYIKKGMAGFRSKLSHMAKFPKDVGIAEERTNGNPNILSQPEFLPVKKINYDEIFGTPSPKKSAKGKTSLTKKTPSRDNNQPHITHRRFLGNDDYRAYICIQYPGKDRIWDSDDEEIKKLDEEPQDELTCQSCNFKTKRLEVMVLHTKMHIQGLYVSAKRKSNKKTKELGISDSDSDIPVTKSPKVKQRKKKEVKPATTDLFNNLLEEWNDTDEEAEEVKKKVTKHKKKVTEAKKVSDSEKEEDQENKSARKEVSKKSEIKEPAEPQSSNKNTYDDIKNCFDFDEDDEEEDFMMPTTVGRKIPRVIPEKPKTSISELLEQEEEIEKASDVAGGSKKETAEPAKSLENGNDLNKKEILRISQSFNRSPTVEENFESTFKELMEETELPPLDDLAQNLKPEQNFHDARAIKFPDKGGTSSKGGAAKGGTSKKRFVTSFEDFEAGFRKIGDEERSRQKLTSDKEVRSAKKPEAIQNNDDNTAQRPSDVQEDILETNRDLDTITSSHNVPEVPESLTRKQSPSRRKTRQSDQEKSIESEDLKVPVESKRKSRRQTKQFVIEEDFEEIIEISKGEDSFDNSTEQIISLMDDKAKEKLAAFDSEIEALKRTLESPVIIHENEASQEQTVDVLNESFAEVAIPEMDEAQAKETETIACDTPLAIDERKEVCIQDVEHEKSKKKTEPTKATPSKTSKKRRSKESDYELPGASGVDTADASEKELDQPKKPVMEERRGRSRRTVDLNAKEEAKSTVTEPEVSEVDKIEKELAQLIEPIFKEHRGKSKGRTVKAVTSTVTESEVSGVDVMKKELDSPTEPVIKEKRGRSRGRITDLNAKEKIKSTVTEPEVSEVDKVEKELAQLIEPTFEELDKPKEPLTEERRGRSRRTADLNAKEKIKSTVTEPEVSEVDKVEKELAQLIEPTFEKLDPPKEPVVGERRGRSRRTVDLNAKKEIKSTVTEPEVSDVDKVEKELAQLIEPTFEKLDQPKEPVMEERRGRSKRTADLNAKEEIKSTVTEPEVSGVDVMEKKLDSPTEPVIKEKRGRPRGRITDLNAKEKINLTLTEPEVSEVDKVEKELAKLIEPTFKERRGQSKGRTDKAVTSTVTEPKVSGVDVIEKELDGPSEPVIKEKRGRSRGRITELNAKEKIKSTVTEPEVSEVDKVEKELAQLIEPTFEKLDQSKETVMEERRGRSRRTADFNDKEEIKSTVPEVTEVDKVERELPQLIGPTLKERRSKSKARTVKEVISTVTEPEVSTVSLVDQELEQLKEPLIKERRGRSRVRTAEELKSTVTQPVSKLDVIEQELDERIESTIKERMGQSRGSSVKEETSIISEPKVLKVHVEEKEFDQLIEPVIKERRGRSRGRTVAELKSTVTKPKVSKFGMESELNQLIEPVVKETRGRSAEDLKSAATESEASKVDVVVKEPNQLIEPVIKEKKSNFRGRTVKNLTSTVTEPEASKVNLMEKELDQVTEPVIKQKRGRSRGRSAGELKSTVTEPGVSEVDIVEKKLDCLIEPVIKEKRGREKVKSTVSEPEITKDDVVKKELDQLVEPVISERRGRSRGREVKELKSTVTKPEEIEVTSESACVTKESLLEILAEVSVKDNQVPDTTTTTFSSDQLQDNESVVNSSEPDVSHSTRRRSKKHKERDVKEENIKENVPDAETNLSNPVLHVEDSALSENICQPAELNQTQSSSVSEAMETPTPTLRRGRSQKISHEELTDFEHTFPIIEEQTVELVSENVDIQPFETNNILYEEPLPKTRKGRQSKLSEKEENIPACEEKISNISAIQPKESLLTTTTKERPIVNIEQLSEKQTQTVHTYRHTRGRPSKHLKKGDTTLITSEESVIHSSAFVETPNDVSTSVNIGEHALNIPMEPRIPDELIIQDIAEKSIDLPNKPRRRTRWDQIPLETKVTEDSVSQDTAERLIKSPSKPEKGKTKHKKEIKQDDAKKATSDIVPDLQQAKDSTDKLSSEQLVEQTNETVVLEQEGTIHKNRRGRPSRLLNEKESIVIEEQTTQTVIESEEPTSLSVDTEIQTITEELKDTVTKYKESATKSKRGRHKERYTRDVEEHDPEAVVESVVGLEITIPVEQPEEILIPQNEAISQQIDQASEEISKDFVAEHSEEQPVTLDATACYSPTSVEVSVDNTSVVSKWNDVSQETKSDSTRESEQVKEDSHKEIKSTTLNDLSNNVDSKFSAIPSVEQTATNQNLIIETTQPEKSNSSKHRKSRTGKHKKEKDTVSHIEEQVHDSLEAKKIESFDSKLTELEKIHSHSAKESKKSSSKSRKSRHRKRSKEKRATQKDLTIDNDMHINQSQVVMELEVPTTSQLDSQKDKASLVEPVMEMPVEDVSKVKRSRSRRSTQDEKNKETESEVQYPDTVGLTTDCVENTPNTSTAKSKKGKSRKHKTEVEILYELEKNLSSINDTKAKEPSNTSTEQEQVNESFSKTRRGRSRKLTQEEEDFARAIEESLKDMAKLPSKVEDTNADFSPETKGVETDKASSTADLSSDASPRSSRRKSRKHSKAKERTLSISDGGKVETTEEVDIQEQSQQTQVDELESVANNLNQEVPKKSGRRRKSQLKTNDQIDPVLNKEETKGDNLVIAENNELSVNSQITEVKTDLEQSSNDPSTQPTPIAEKELQKADKNELIQEPKDVELVLEHELISKDLENANVQSNREIEENEVTKVEQDVELLESKVLDISVSEEPTIQSDLDIAILEKPTEPEVHSTSTSEEPVAKIRPGKRRRSSKNEQIAITEDNNLPETSKEVLHEIKAGESDLQVVEFDEQSMQVAFNNTPNFEITSAIQKHDIVNNILNPKVEEQIFENQTDVTDSSENKILESFTEQIVNKDDGVSKKAVDQANYFLSSPSETQNSMEDKDLSVMEAEDKPLATQTMMDATCLYKFDSNSMDSTDVNPREIISDMFEKHEPHSEDTSRDKTEIKSLTEDDVHPNNLLENKLNEPSSDDSGSFIKEAHESFATKNIFGSVTADFKELNKYDQEKSLPQKHFECETEDDKLTIIESENENRSTNPPADDIVDKAQIVPVTATDLNLTQNIEIEVDNSNKELEVTNLFDQEKDKNELLVVSENDSNKVEEPILDFPAQEISSTNEQQPSYSGSTIKKSRAEKNLTDGDFKQESDVSRELVQMDESIQDVIKEFIEQEISSSLGPSKTKKKTEEKTRLTQAQDVIDSVDSSCQLLHTTHEVSKTEMEGLSDNKGRPRKYSKTENSLTAALTQTTLSSLYNDKTIAPAVQSSKKMVLEKVYSGQPVDNKRHVPPKKSRWSRRGSYSNKDDNVQIELKEQTPESTNKDSVTEQHVITKDFVTDNKSDLNDNNKLNKKTDETETNLRSEIQEISTSLNESEIILPPKKSKRGSETKFSLLHDSFNESPFSDKKPDGDILSFPSCDDSIMSTSLRHNIEGLIKDIDNFDNTFESDSLNKSLEGEKMPGPSKVEDVKSELVLEHSVPVISTIKEPSDISKCVPPKKKRIDPDLTNMLENNVLTTDTPKIEEKLAEVIPPKRKIQKLFETSQTLEKLEKVNDIHQMSPLAKKKSFLFHQEEFQHAEKAEVVSKIEADFVKDIEDKKTEINTVLLEGASMKSGEDITCDSRKAKTDEDKGLSLLPKKRKKRKSSSHGEHAQKRERRSSSEPAALPDGQKEDSSNDLSKEIEALNEKQTVLQTENTVAVNVDGNKKQPEEPKKTEVTFESDEMHFCIQTNLSNLSTSTAEELSAIATATLSEIKREVVVETSSQVDSVSSTKITKIDDVAVKTELTKNFGNTSEPEYVPISVTPTVMSEKDLDDAQVEITTNKVISEKKPTNLAMFSMDYLESNQPSHIRPVSNKHLKKDVVSSSKGANTTGTEFTSKAITTKEFDNRPLVSQPKAYALKSELLDILEGNSNSSTNSSGSEQKFKTSFDNYDKQTTVQGIFDFEEAIPSQIVLSNKVDPETVLMDSPKLLERLSMANDPTKAKSKKVLVQSDIKVSEGLPKTLMTKIPKPVGTPKPGQKIVIKTTKAQLSAMPKTIGNKPIILSEQIIRPANTVKTTKAPIQPQGVKRQYEDIEDVEAAFIIPKIAKKVVEEESTPAPPEKLPRSRGSKASGKAKILQQTIITPKGEIIQPQAAAAAKALPTAQIKVAQSQPDELVFDINSMPIVLSDDLLTPESIQNMPVVLSEEVVAESKPVTSFKAEEKTLATMGKKVVGSKQIVFKTTQPGSNTPVHVKHTTKPRILSNAQPGKVAKPGPTTLLATGTSADGKPTKYVLVPSTVTQAISQVKTVKQPMIKKQPVTQSKLLGVQTGDQPTAPMGNKIMIVTNQHGQQTRVVLTPQQQKAFMQGQPGSKTKTIIKGALPKALLETGAVPGPSGVVQKTGLIAVTQAASPAVSSHGGGLLMTVGKSTKVTVQQPKKTAQRTPTKPQKTILIKNQLGQTVRKIQGTDDADLDRQVAEQLEAIKASARLQQTNKSPEIINYTSRPIPASTNSTKTAVRRTFSKKIDPAKVKPTVSTPQTPSQKSPPDPLVPALAPLSPQSRIPQVQTSIGAPKQPTSKPEPAPSPGTPTKVPDTMVVPQQPTTAASSKADAKGAAALPTSGTTDGKPPDRPLTQLVIQDGLGNQTTITEGQILAIPSETVDGQPQSYMLVTLDEMGNITPLNNEALMSLDPSLGLGGDLNNMVLQVDQGQGMVAAFQSPEAGIGVVAESNVVEPKKEERLKAEVQKPTATPLPEPKQAPAEPPQPQEGAAAVEQQIVIGEGVLPGADAGGQQLIVTGDPIATQKFLESLSDGSTDLANILANAEGGSVLIQADGQQILIKTNTGGQPLMGIAENTEAGGNPIFGTHKPNQDILAAALANTDVFQPSDQSVVAQSPLKGLPSSQLSPGGVAGGVLYPMHVGNVLETSLTLSSPIMTPLEVPSGPGKKIDDDVDILNQIPKNVDLPITITDPNISQTVAQQQALGLMELGLPITETSAADMHSPSYSYSLPALDVSASQKPFNGSMPLLTEDVTEGEGGTSSELGKIRVAKGLHQERQGGFGTSLGSLPMLAEAIELSREEVVKTSGFEDMGSLLSEDVIEDSGSSLGSTRPARSSPKPIIERDIVDEGLSTLGGEMCSSLSEPPPDMFDLASITGKEEEVSSDMSSVPEPEGGETVSLHSENSSEIPLQPPIVADLNELKRAAEAETGREERHELKRAAEGEERREEKRHKFD